MNYQDKYITTLEEILVLRQEIDKSSLVLYGMEERISNSLIETDRLEKKLRSFDSTEYKLPLLASARPEDYKTPRSVGERKDYARDCARACAMDCAREDKKRTRKTPKKIVKRTQYKKQAIPAIKQTTKELPPIEINPDKYVEWTRELQESLICWNEIIKSTHPGSLSHLSFTDKFTIEQAVHDFLSTRLHWRDIQYCAAINKVGIIYIAIPEDWADDFSDWFSERIGAGLLDSKVREKKRSPKMQPVLGVVRVLYSLMK